jgi:hypothetical protein
MLPPRIMGNEQIHILTRSGCSVRVIQGLSRLPSDILLVIP